MAWKIERNRSAPGGQRLQDGIPGSAVKRELAKEDEGGTRCSLVAVDGGRETGPGRGQGQRVRWLAIVGSGRDATRIGAARPERVSEFTSPNRRSYLS